MWWYYCVKNCVISINNCLCLYGTIIFFVWYIQMWTVDPNLTLKYIQYTEYSFSASSCTIKLWMQCVTCITVADSPVHPLSVNTAYTCHIIYHKLPTHRNGRHAMDRCAPVVSLCWMGEISTQWRTETRSTEIVSVSRAARAFLWLWWQWRDTEIGDTERRGGQTLFFSNFYLTKQTKSCIISTVCKKNLQTF